MKKWTAIRSRYILSTFPELDQLRRENNAVERNRLALELAESADPRVLPVLIELIERDDLRNARGTLVYCLQPFDLSGHFELLIRLLITGNWEVSHEAFDRIASLDSVGGETAERGWDALEAAVKDDHEEWRRQLIADVMCRYD